MDNKKINAEMSTDVIFAQNNISDNTECNNVNESESEMKDEVQARKEEIKQEDSKKVGLFILILILSGVLGGFLGAGGVAMVISLRESGLSFVEFCNQLQKDFAVPASFLLVILDAIFLMISFSFYNKAKKLWKSNMDEDEKYEAVDKKLSLGLLFTNVTYFINFAFFGFAFYAGMSFEEGVSESWILIYMRMVDLVVFVATLFLGLAIQKGCINQSKLMNPEKKGSVYDMKFDKVWYESCDEAERMQIGIAAYKTVKATNMALLVLLVVFVLAGMFFEIGILPLVVITVIALVVNITYSVTAMKTNSGCVNGGFKI